MNPLLSSGWRVVFLAQTMSRAASRLNGEVFGWSSLVGRANYSASAGCMTPTKLLRFDKNRLQEIIQKDAASSIALFQNLAAILGERLIRSYEFNISATGGDAYASVGTGQVMEVAETELET